MAQTLLPDLVSAARRHQALSDPTRLLILEALARGEQCVCDLTGSLGVAQSRLSFHLKALKEAGFLRARRAGRWVYYAIDPDGLTETGAYLADLTERSSSAAGKLGCDPTDGECCG